MSDKEKKYDKQYVNEQAKKLAKSLYKSVKNKLVAKQIVKDILDPDYVAEVDPVLVPKGKQPVMKKSKDDADKSKKMDKAEDFVSQMIKDFKDIASNYNKLQKTTRFEKERAAKFPSEDPTEARRRRVKERERRDVDKPQEPDLLTPDQYETQKRTVRTPFVSRKARRKALRDLLHTSKQRDRVRRAKPPEDATVNMGDTQTDIGQLAASEKVST